MTVGSLLRPAYVTSQGWRQVCVRTACCPASVNRGPVSSVCCAITARPGVTGCGGPYAAERPGRLLRGTGGRWRIGCRRGGVNTAGRSVQLLTLLSKGRGVGFANPGRVAPGDIVRVGGAKTHASEAMSCISPSTVFWQRLL